MVAIQKKSADPVFERLRTARYSIEGEMGRRVRAVTEQWILPLPVANPGLLEMFRYRDRQPYREMVPWAGEFAGKYLTHMVQIYRLQPTEELKKHIDWFVGELVGQQAGDGYLGPWPERWRLRAGGPNCAEPWDAWGHYHIMIGLLMWHETGNDARALGCVRRIGDLFCTRFLDQKSETLHGTGAHEMNLAPVHALALLYRLTDEERYLAMALQIVREFEIPPAGDYLRAALAGTEFFLTPKPRWESLHPIMGLAELYYATGEEKYRRAFEQIWWSIVKTDRHNNGGFSSGEKAQGTPYHTGPIETCCTVAWAALSVEMLRLTGNPLVADELELSLFNAGLGSISPSGRWVTYNTPMVGEKKASAHEIVFQARAGTPELNCCSVNGPRMLGMISDWAVMAAKEGVVLNYYGPMTVEVTLPSGPTVTLAQETSYPRENRVDLAVLGEREAHFRLGLRIPSWSRETMVRINGVPVSVVPSGRYLWLDRTWAPGDKIALEFDFRPHFWVHEERVILADGPGRLAHASIYRGPILLTHDPRFDAPGDSREVRLSAELLELKPVEWPEWLKPWILLETPASDGPAVRLCDFASAGLTGGPAYETWLQVQFAESTPGAGFTAENPWRSFRTEIKH